MSCPECAGRSLVAPCPLCAVDEPESVLEPIEAGRYARECCEARESNPYASADARAEWFEGWDESDLEDDEEHVPDYDADEITAPLDCLSLSKLAGLLERFSETAQLQFAILKHDLRGMTVMPPAMASYVETLRQCHEIQTQLQRRTA